MPLIIDFKNDPLGFLADNVVVVGMQQEEASAPAKPKRFFMARRHDDSNVVELRFKMVGGTDDNSLEAYWLPWHNKKAVTLTLGGLAKFMFTTEMTNCRFSVLTANEATPTVAHVAGTGSSGQRDTWEQDAGLPKRGEEGERRMRRMSKSGAELHGYAGQKGNKSSSTFVFGQFSGERWAFYGQVVEGIMDGNTIDKGAYPKQAKQIGVHEIDA